MPNDHPDFTIAISLYGPSGPPVTTKDLPDWTQAAAVVAGGLVSSRFQRPTSQALPHGVQTYIAWDDPASTDWNDLALTFSDPTTIVIAADGKYRISLNAQYLYGAAGSSDHSGELDLVLGSSDPLYFVSIGDTFVVPWSLGITINQELGVSQDFSLLAGDTVRGSMITGDIRNQAIGDAAISIEKIG